MNHHWIRYLKQFSKIIPKLLPNTAFNLDQYLIPDHPPSQSQNLPVSYKPYYWQYNLNWRD